MDATVLLQAIASFLAILLLYSLWLSRSNNYGARKITQAPKPKGAWPILGHLPLLGGTDPIFKILGTMADQCGPVFRIQLGLHQALVVSSKDAVREIFTSNDLIFMTRPKSLALKYMGYNGALFALAPYGSFWREIRKITSFEVLSNRRLELLKPLRATEMSTCIKELYSRCYENGIAGTAKIDIGQWLQQVVFNIMTQMIATKRYNSVGNGENKMEAKRFIKVFEEYMSLVGAFELSNVIPFTEWMDLQGNRRSMRRTAKELDYFMSSWLDEHYQRRAREGPLKEDHDFIDVMISLFSESGGLIYGHKSADVIKATAMTLIFAGGDTSALTLTWAISSLLQHKEKLQRAQEELDIHLRKTRWVEESDIKHLIYLQAIVKETLRLYPGGPLSVPREALEDCTVAGHYVPKGTQLWVNIWKLHRDSGSWTDPYEFQPERFLTSHVGTDIRGQQFEYIPFSSGRRSCPGMTASMQMMHLTLARLLQGFDLKTPTNEPVNMTEASGITLHRKYPLEVVLTPRLPNKLYQN